MMRDYVYRVHGDCVRAGYAYPLLAALKQPALDLAQDERVFFGPLEGVSPLGSGYLGIRKVTYWRCRAPSDMQNRMYRLCGTKLLVASHVIQLGKLHVEDLSPAKTLHAEFVAIKSQHFQKHEKHPCHREFLGWVTDKLRSEFALSGAMVEVGRRRILSIGENPASTGYGLCIYGLDDRQSIAIQCSGIGGRRHMGGALFRPGRLPPHVKDKNELYEVAEKKWHRKKKPPVIDHDYTRRAALFMTAVGEGKYPDHSWLARQEGISNTQARNLILSFCRDLQMPIKRDPARKGWSIRHE